MFQHKNGIGGGFSSRYRTRRLVWFEIHENPLTAILREKQLKAGSRMRKLRLIESTNPGWQDLTPGH